MNCRINTLTFLVAFISVCTIGCSKSAAPEPTEINNAMLDDYETPTADEIAELTAEETNVLPPLNSLDDVKRYLCMSTDSAAYANGVIPTIADADYKYARRLLNSSHKKFILVDKNTMTVRLYDKLGKELKSYKMACAKNYGHKQKKADSRTPEGFFSVYGTYDSTDWLFVDDNGKKSDIKGQFGPRFIRLLIPGTSQIGIHGTCAPWSLGGRRSHGCIRISNDDILELVQLVDSGMPVIVNPGPRDAVINEMEGMDIPIIDLVGDIESRLRYHRKVLLAELAEKAKADSISADTIAAPIDINESIDSLLVHELASK